MKKTILPAIIALIVLVASIFFINHEFGIVKFSTNIESPITSDTTWLKSKSPYLLLGPTQLELGVKLIVEPGVVVDLNGFSIDVMGTFIAKGATNEKIYINNGSLIFSNESNVFNSTIENAVLGDQSGITVESGSPLISNNTIKGNLSINGGSPIIAHNSVDTRIIVKGGSPTFYNNVISDGIHADAKGGPVTIESNQITSKSGFSVVYIQGIHAEISGNTILGSKNNIGIQIYHVISSASITNNEISNSSYGIHIFTGTPSHTFIAHNAIFNNTVGINNRCSMTLQDNTIAFNEIGLQCAHLNTIQNNNFENNIRYNIKSGCLVDFDVANNWWGTTDVQLIEQYIFDGKDDSIKGEVFFTPFLRAPNPNAPAIPANTAPISTINTGEKPPQTELFPTMIAAAVTLAVTLVVATGLLVLRKKHKHNDSQETLTKMLLLIDSLIHLLRRYRRVNDI